MSSFIPDKMFNDRETNQQVADATELISDFIVGVLKTNGVTVRMNYITSINSRMIACDGMEVEINRFTYDAAHVWVGLKDKRRRNKCNRVIKQLRLIGYRVLLTDAPLGADYYF